MLLVPCPMSWCGPREEIEFRYGGQAGIAYPTDPEALSDEAWANFLFLRDNPKGAFTANAGTTSRDAAGGSRPFETR